MLSGSVLLLLEGLAAIKIDRGLEGEYVEELLNAKRQPTIFPMLYNTDRPDSVTAGVMDGKIAVFIDGTPFVLLLPALFADFIQSAEDYVRKFTGSRYTDVSRDRSGGFVAKIASKKAVPENGLLPGVS